MSDRRHARAERSKAAILTACRWFMETGAFRPPMKLVCYQAGQSLRNGFHHFGSVDGLYVAALADIGVREAIAQRVIGAKGRELLDDEASDRIVRAVVLGTVVLGVER